MSETVRRGAKSRTLPRFEYLYVRDAGASWAGVPEALFERVPAILEAVPAYDSLYVEFDSRSIDAVAVRREVLGALAAVASEAAAQPRRLVTLPVAYGGSHGPDLAAVAERAGVTAARAAEIHAGAEYEVAALGFSPGFPFLTGVPAALRSPRRATPRAQVPAHSVAIANQQCGIYPQATPGGWNLIGAALKAVYDPWRDEPFLLRPGDRVRFEPRDGEPPPAPSAYPLLPSEPRLPALLVLASGLNDLVVDGGRFRSAHLGLARSGPLDVGAARTANLLVGNDPLAPLLELALTGPTFEVLSHGVAAVAGAGLAPRVNGRDVELGLSFALRRGDRLDFRPLSSGCRAYLALAGGIAAERFRGSASADLRGAIGRPLRPGDVLGRAGESRALAGRAFAGPSRRGWPSRLRLRPGPQADPAALAALTRGDFEVGRSDRTAIRLGGRHVPGGEIVSEGVPVGAVQVTPAGEPIVLLANRGTIGGYAKPAVVHPDDLDALAQLRQGERVRFVLAP